jgi:RNA polymerase sigma factor (sigma-70 family)
VKRLAETRRSDTELLLAARKDGAAFTEFYRVHAEWIYRWLSLQVGDAHLASDLTAETFAQALVSLHRFRGREPGAGTAWLFAIARNLLRRSYERRRVEVRARARLGMPLRDYVPDDYEAVDERLDAAAFAAELDEALGALTPELREALELRVVDGLSYAEISLATRVSEPNARARVSRALRALSTRLTPDKESVL